MIGTTPALGRLGPDRTSSRPVERGLWIAATAVAVLLIALLIGLTIYGVSHRDRIYGGVSVAGQDLGGLSRGEAIDRLEAFGAGYGAQPLTVTADGETFQTTPSDIGFDLDSAASVDAAFAYGRDGSWWSRTQDWAAALIHGRTVAPDVQLDGARVDQYVAEVSEAVSFEPVDAAVVVDAGGTTLSPARDGRGLDGAASASRLTSALRGLSAGPVALVTTTTAPDVSTASLEGAVPQAVAATDAPLVLSAPEGQWTIPQGDLAAIVSVDPETASLEIDRDAIAAVVGQVAAEIDQPAVNAGISLSEDGQFSVVPGAEARAVDVAATTDAAIAALGSGSDATSVVVERTPPAITDEMATRGVAEAESYVADGLTLTWDGGRQQFDRADLLSALVIYDTGGDPFLFQFDADVLAGLAAPGFDRVDDPAEDARFRLVDGQVTQTQSSKDGRVVDRTATIEAMLGAIYGHEPQVAMVVVDDRATVTDDMRDDIAVPDLLAQGITYYEGSSAPRKKNVERAAELEDGWLIAPGAVWSYNAQLGAVDETNGFDVGFGIVADQERGGVTTAPVIGGGICQVSTTIFQAGWWSGLEVVERYQHPYWLTGYGVEPLGRTGLDAMVNIEDTWSLDLKFRNTTGNWIAFVITADGSALTVSLYGTNPQWDVEVSDPIETARVEASDEVEYVDSSELPAGQELQVETAYDGFTVRIDRTVTDREGQVILEDDISSEYAPSRNLVLRGTGTGTDG